MTANPMPKGQIQVETFPIMQEDQVGIQQYPQNQISSPKP